MGLCVEWTTGRALGGSVALSVGLTLIGTACGYSAPSRPASTTSEAASSAARVAEPKPIASVVEPAAPSERAPEAPVSESAEQAPERSAVVGVALHDTLQVRETPGVEGRVLGALPPTATELEVVGEAVSRGGSRWTPVRFGDGTGWVNRRYLATQYGHAPEALVRRAHEALLLITAREWTRLAGMVHPRKGLLFSPLGYLEPTCLRVSAKELPRWVASKEKRLWGMADGSGMEIRYSFEDYYPRYVVDRDFLRADEIAFGRALQRGNELDNIEEIFPGASVVEYYVDARDHGLDWHSLRLVFEREGDAWFLVAIVHVEWTI